MPDPAAVISDRRVVVPDEALGVLCGPHDENLKRIERTFGVEVGARGGELHVRGAEPGAERAAHLVAELVALLDRGYDLRARDLQTAIRVIQESPQASLVDFFLGEGLVATARRMVAPRSLNQQRYLRAMQDHDLVISVGPAGTGKTYLAVAMAAAALVEKKVRRIVLARPAVEAGEKLGFLPGDLAAKVNPYLRPLYDALYDILGFEQVSRMLEREIIEVAPLAFMRGRTLNESFIILDEAQNTTPEQMKMFLTRIGFGSKAVVNGDVTQVDLPAGRVSGLREAVHVLEDVEGVAFVEFGQADVVRHELVQRIVRAYAALEGEGSVSPVVGRKVATPPADPEGDRRG
ncbi:MAG TPA: PhoH family protein [Thermoanaerobaculia bacterium]|nr:PhoH family protein [Thermoanaerobaculia bacterium]